MIKVSFLKGVDTKFDCYNFAKSDPSLFYQLKEAGSINQIYRNIELLKQENDSGFSIEQSAKVVKLIIIQIELLFSKKS